MNTVIQKLGTYHILANLIPGAFFCLALDFLFGITLPVEGIGGYIIAYYFVGLIIGRIGALITKRVFTRKEGTKKVCFTQFIEYVAYADYVEAETSSPKIAALSDTNECYRSLLTCVWLLPAVKGFYCLAQRFSLVSDYWMWVALPLLFGLFLWSYKEQAGFIKRRVKSGAKGNE